MTTVFLLVGLLPAAAWIITSVLLRDDPVPGSGRGLPLAWFALATVAAHGIAQAVGADGWGHLHVAYLVLTVSIPLCGAVVLVSELARGRRARPALVALGIAGLAPAAIGYYATHVEPYRVSLEVATLDVPGLGGGDGGEVRIAVYSDPQMTGLGEHETAALRRLDDEEPHLLLVPGDVFSAPFDVLRDDVVAFRRLLRTVEVPVLVVTGDHDQRRTLDWLARGTDIVVLDDAIEVVDAGGVDVAVAGVGHGTSSEDAREVVGQLATTPADVRLVLSHEPEVVGTVRPGDGVDLVIAGDTHGGQVRLPLIGLPYNPSDVPDDVAAGGLHRLGGVDVYVSRGVGLLRGQAPQLRLGAPPAVDLITLR